MHKLQEPNLARKILGSIFALVSLVNVIANILWLQSGDVHKPQFHFVMRGGWNGFWFVTVIAVLLGALGLYLLMTKEPVLESKNKTVLSEEEKKNLKKDQPRNLLLLALSWSLLILSMFSLNYLWMTVGISGVFCVGVAVFSKRCPNCGYRLVYSNQLILPRSCPGCGIELK
ncbi:MAG TPA: hypothetical protein PLO78_10165 [Candidatus Omnitrophota bacterium]|nr:hypothetical protein [Candidatus Omnitrophota bacterium]